MERRIEQGLGESQSESFHCPQECVTFLAYWYVTICRILPTMEVLEEHVIGWWKKGDPCCKMAKNLTELCFVEGRKLGSDNINI